jgi:hypothetical protein
MRMPPGPFSAVMVAVVSMHEAVPPRRPITDRSPIPKHGVADPLGRIVTRTAPFVETHAVGRVQRTSTVPLSAHLAGFVGPVTLLTLLVLALPFRARRHSERPVHTAPFGLSHGPFSQPAPCAAPLSRPRAGRT